MSGKVAVTRSYIGLVCTRGCGIGWGIPGLVPWHSTAGMGVWCGRWLRQRGGGRQRPPVPGQRCPGPGKKWIDGPAYLF